MNKKAARRPPSPEVEELRERMRALRRGWKFGGQQAFARRADVDPGIVSTFLSGSKQHLDAGTYAALLRETQACEVGKAVEAPPPAAPSGPALSAVDEAISRFPWDQCGHDLSHADIAAVIDRVTALAATETRAFPVAAWTQAIRHEVEAVAQRRLPSAIVQHKRK